MDKKYVSHLYNLDAQASGLLGFFDSDGQYVIEDKIVQELIICNKIIASATKEAINATATVGEYKLNFIIYLQDGEGNKKRAGLFVNEKAKIGIVEKELSTYVDSLVLDNTPVFFDEVKKRFHLFTQDESTGIDIDFKNQGLKEIINKKNESVKKYKVFIPLYMDKEKEYVKKMLELLKDSGEHGVKLLKMFKKELENNKTPKISPNYWREARLMLDKILLQNKDVLPIHTIQKMGDFQQILMGELAKIKEPTSASKPKAQKSKPPAKKKGGDDDEKKDDKKKKNAKKDKPKDKPAKKNSQEQEVIIEKTTTIEIETDSSGNAQITVEEEFSMFGRGFSNDVKQEKKSKRSKKQETEREM